jgi:hypothetical protein
MIEFWCWVSCREFSAQGIGHLIVWFGGWIDKGRIVEYDRPINLLRRQDSMFHDMCQKSGEFDVLVQMATNRNE